MFMIMCVVDDGTRLNEVLDAWKNLGIGGVTVIESTGLHRLRTIPAIPMRYTFGLSNVDRGNYTLFSVVDGEELVQACLETTEKVLGSLTGPNTGIFTAWPLAIAAGISRTSNRQEGNK